MIKNTMPFSSIHLIELEGVKTKNNIGYRNIFSRLEYWLMWQRTANEGEDEKQWYWLTITLIFFLSRKLVDVVEGSKLGKELC